VVSVESEYLLWTALHRAATTLNQAERSGQFDGRLTKQAGCCRRVAPGHEQAPRLVDGSSLARVLPPSGP
jgi:hypothetical protein